MQFDLQSIIVIFYWVFSIFDLPAPKLWRFGISVNYFTLLIGLIAKVDSNALYETMKPNEIQSKKYLYPPVRLQTSFANVPRGILEDLRNTIHTSEQPLGFPLCSHVYHDQLERMCKVVAVELRSTSSNVSKL